jgi:ATP-dependent protease HslVU (ClpYQ) peptidase subunit
MTVIAAVVNENGSYIAGDRGASDDNIILPLAHPKIWQLGNYLFGYYGSMDGEKVMYNFEPPVPTALQKKNIDKFMGNEFVKSLKEFYDEHFVFIGEKEVDFGMIIIADGKMYEHDAGTMSMTRFDTDYLSVGSGSEYAFGSLYTTQSWTDGKKRVRTAIEVATKYSPSCMQPIDVLSIPRKETK